MTTKLLCTCGKHEEELKQMIKQKTPEFNLMKEMLDQQAREIFENIQKRIENHVIGECSCPSWTECLTNTEEELNNLKKKWVK